MKTNECFAHFLICKDAFLEHRLGLVVANLLLLHFRSVDKILELLGARFIRKHKKANRKIKCNIQPTYLLSSADFN